MAKDKFYYIDKDGNKKKYIGKVISNNGSYEGTLININKENVNKELIYHPEVEEVEGYLSYYSYINSENKEVRYYDSIKKDNEGNTYFTYTERQLFRLDYNEPIVKKEDYFTYIDPLTNEEKLYNGTILYNKRTNSYSGVITIIK